MNPSTVNQQEIGITTLKSRLVALRAQHARGYATGATHAWLKQLQFEIQGVETALAERCTHA